MDTGYWITTVIGAYAAGVATYGVWSKKKGDRRSAKVIVKQGLHPLGVGHDYCFVVYVCNAGKRPITIQSAELLWSDSSNTFSFPALACGTIPCELSDGQSCTFQFPFSAYVQAVKARGLVHPIQVHAKVYDVAGDVYKCAWKSVEQSVER